MNRIHRRTFDIDSAEAKKHAPLGDDGSFESSEMMRQALLETVTEVRRTTAQTTRYGQGIITRVGEAAMRTLFNPKHGFDHFTGTNDLANSQIAKHGIFCMRQWQRVKPVLESLGLISFVHRSIPTGLGKAPGVEQHIQISDLYWFSPANLVPWVKEIFDTVHARIKAKWLDREKGKPRVRRPLVKRDRPHCRIPALLNPIGWARAKAAEAAAHMHPVATYESEEARAIAFATEWARATIPG
ncbi:hypothetical protein SIL82_10610 [Sphingomonas echinoides]|uniref:Uncharacterized protein n=1 Tax=Sphingomonas echinoides TaxID=59803 RepID=A0ABU4PM25_9SPHN|nr:hypothetical protein [Sphingomonas echinoides]MDX5984715.1 hypothetical protein [Sphingomonas echinoides]